MNLFCALSCVILSGVAKDSGTRVRDFMVSPFLGPKIGEDQNEKTEKKKVFVVKLLGFGANEVGELTK